MSYIRCLSNPEGLYIFGSRQGVEIYASNSFWHLVPQETWDGLCQKFVEDYNYEDCEYNGLSIKEEKRGHDFKYVLSYEDWEIEMWLVTWFYIIRRYEHDPQT